MGLIELLSDYHNTYVHLCGGSPAVGWSPYMKQGARMGPCMLLGLWVCIRASVCMHVWVSSASWLWSWATYCVCMLMQT